MNSQGMLVGSLLKISNYKKEKFFKGENICQMH